MPIWKRKKARIVGMDIGSSSVKIVELVKSGERKSLNGYAEYRNPDFGRSFQPFTKDVPQYSQKELASLIRWVVREAGIKCKDFILSLPAPSTFITTFELPFMKSGEISTAVMHEARQRVPVPLGEVEVDWTLLHEGARPGTSAFYEILLVAAPKEIIARYAAVAKQAGFSLAGIEAEAFSLVRSLIRDEPYPVVIVDIGASSTSINVVEQESIRFDHHFWIGGGELTTKIMQSTGQSRSQAEYYKRKMGVQASSSESIEHVLIPLVDQISQEVAKVVEAYRSPSRKEIKRIILTGGSASLKGLKELFETKFNKEILTANPLSGIFYPPILTPVIKEIGPAFSVAVGLALRGLE